jgi:hypothetical protein
MKSRTFRFCPVLNRVLRIGVVERFRIDLDRFQKVIFGSLGRFFEQFEFVDFIIESHLYRNTQTGKWNSTFSLNNFDN